jgi:hypothetical protein
MHVGRPMIGTKTLFTLKYNITTFSNTFLYPPFNCCRIRPKPSRTCSMKSEA